LDICCKVANAVGAALAQVSGSFSRTLTNMSRSEALAHAKAEAIQPASDNGAKRENVEIVKISEVPVAYMADAVHFSVKAVGDLDTARAPKVSETVEDREESSAAVTPSAQVKLFVR
jgi:hypothetical protein